MWPEDRIPQLTQEPQEEVRLMFKRIAHLGMWACTWIAFWQGAQLNGGPDDDFVVVLFWILCGFALWFVADPHEHSSRQGS